MDLNFEIFMIALLVLSILVIGNFLCDKECNYLEGALLVVSQNRVKLLFQRAMLIGSFKSCISSWQQRRGFNPIRMLLHPMELLSWSMEQAQPVLPR